MFEQLMIVFAARHVDKIDSYNSTHIAQAHNTGNFGSRFHVYFQCIFFLRFFGILTITTIHINYVHSFGMFNNKITTFWKRYLFTEQCFYLAVNTKLLKNIFGSAMHFYNAFALRRNRTYVGFYFFVQRGIIYRYAIKFLIKNIAQQ